MNKSTDVCLLHFQILPHSLLLLIASKCFTKKATLIHLQRWFRDVPAEAWPHFLWSSRFATSEAEVDFGPSWQSPPAASPCATGEQRLCPWQASGTPWCWVARSYHRGITRSRKHHSLHVHDPPRTKQFPSRDTSVTLEGRPVPSKSLMPTTFIPRGEKKKLEGILLSVMLLVLKVFFLMLDILLPYISYPCSRKELPRSSSSKWGNMRHKSYKTWLLISGDTLGSALGSADTSRIYNSVQTSAIEQFLWNIGHIRMRKVPNTNKFEPFSISRKTLSPFLLFWFFLTKNGLYFPRCKLWFRCESDPADPCVAYCKDVGYTFPQNLNLRLQDETTCC